MLRSQDELNTPNQILVLRNVKIQAFQLIGVRPLSGIFGKNVETHVALCGNFSGPICSTDPVKVSKDAASLLVCIRKNFLLGGAVFL